MTHAGGELAEAIQRHLSETMADGGADIPEPDSGSEGEEDEATGEGELGSGARGRGRGRRVTLKLDQLRKLRLIAAALRPFYETTIMLEGDTDVSVSCVLPELKQLIKLAISSKKVELEPPVYKINKEGKLELVKEAVTVDERELPSDIAALRNKLMEQLDKRWGAESKIASLNAIYRLSTALDSPLLTDRDRELARKLVLQHALTLVREEREGEDERPKKKQKAEGAAQPVGDPRFWRLAAEQQEKEERAKERAKQREARENANSEVQAEEQKAVEEGEEGEVVVELDFEVEVKSEVDQYFRLQITDTSGSPIKWWREHRGALPVLSKLALQYLSIPSSSASVERVFSQAGLTLTKLRNRMGADTLEELLMIKYHHHAHGMMYYTPKQWAAVTQAVMEKGDEAIVIEG